MMRLATTCAELYQCSDVFRGFIAQWVEDKRCPLELVDYLLDIDFERASEIARWAATVELRHTPDDRWIRHGMMHCAFPLINAGGIPPVKYYWFGIPNTQGTDCNMFVCTNKQMVCQIVCGDTIEEAIYAFLDAVEFDIEANRI